MDSFRPARARRLYEDVVSQVLELIASGELPPGERLPPERELAGRIGVSRSVLREAFRVLEERGIVLSRQGSGRRIRMPVGDGGRVRPAPVGDLERGSIVDILEARELLEVEIAALACSRINEDEVFGLREVASKGSDWSGNVDFHVRLAQVTKNFMLERLVGQQMELLSEVHQRSHYGSPADGARLIADHVAIGDAVIARDADRARETMKRHFSRTREVILREVTDVGSIAQQSGHSP